jgi:signal transduction histidine kinase
VRDDSSKPLVIVFSEDGGLAELCRDVCREVVDGARVIAAPAGSAPPGADYCIWDVKPGLAPDAAMVERRPDRHLFVIDRSNLAWLGEHGLSRAMIALKPLTRPNLLAFLRPALSAGHRTDWNEAPRDRYALLESLLQATVRLQEYDQERTTFLACAAHEFRVPLTAIEGYCGLLLGGSAGELTEKHRQIVSRLERSARRLNRLAAGMHRLSLGERVPAPDLQPRSIVDSIDQALHECRHFLDDKQVVVALSVEPPPAVLHYEGGQIEQVLVNLLENACAHVGRAGSVRIRAYPWVWERRKHGESFAGAERRSGRGASASNSYRVDVFDDGPPLAEEELARIFDEYVSLRPASRKRGSGLGLAICRQILALHSGVIWAETCPDGKQFSFVLPYRNEPGAAVAALLQAAACGAAVMNEINTI